MNINDFRKKLIEVRKSKGLTQTEVAEQCNVTLRTIQRIESGAVEPRASTIKIISENIGFEFFESYDTGYDDQKIQSSKFKTFLWYLKDFFNLKTHTMKKISILSILFLSTLFISINSFSNGNEKSDNKSKNDSCQISPYGETMHLEKDVRILSTGDENGLANIKVYFSDRYSFDDLFYLKQDLKDKGIDIGYNKLKFDDKGFLIELAFQVDCNDGFKGSYHIIDLRKLDKHDRIGFIRDYRNSDCPFEIALYENYLETVKK